jgi:hypothetical protein
MIVSLPAGTAVGARTRALCTDCDHTAVCVTVSLVGNKIVTLGSGNAGA